MSSKKNKINDIIKRLTDINIELIRDHGSEAYEIRCKIYDIKEELIKFQQATVSVSVCENVWCKGGKVYINGEQNLCEECKSKKNGR